MWVVCMGFLMVFLVWVLREYVVCVYVWIFVVDGCLYVFVCAQDNDT